MGELDYVWAWPVEAVLARRPLVPWVSVRSNRTRLSVHVEHGAAAWGCRRQVLSPLTIRKGDSSGWSELEKLAADFEA